MNQVEAKEGASENRESVLKQSFFMFLLALVVSGILQAHTLNSFFIFDDVSMFKHASPLFGNSLATCFKTMSNGFWRPLNRILFWALDVTIGKTPIYYHLVTLIIHSIVCAATFAAARIFFRLDRRVAILSSILCIFNVGGFSARIELSSTCDSLVVLFLLLALTFWQLSLTFGRKRDLFFFFVSFIMGTMSKETFVVLPVFLLLSIVIHGRFAKKALLLLILIFILSFVHGAITMFHQNKSASYTQEGRVSLNAFSLIRQFADYGVSLIVPYAHILQWPFKHLSFSRPILWVLRISFACLAVVASFAFLAKEKFRPLLLPLLMAGIILLPVTIITDAPQSRFLYPAIPFFSISIAALFYKARSSYRGSAWILLLVFFGLHSLGFYFSPTINGYVETCAKVGAFVRESKRASINWMDHETVAIFHHPHPGLESQRWGYCQQLFDVFIPEKDETLELDRISPETSHAYDFVDNALVEVAIR